MRCVKRLGERFMAKDPDEETAEIHIRTALINRLPSPATAKTICVI